MKPFVCVGSLLLLAILGSCMKEIGTEFDQVYYHPEYSIPIGRVRYSINEIMPEDSLNAADTATHYYNELIYYTDQAYEVPSENYQQLYVVPADMSELSRKSDNTRSVLLRCNLANSIPVVLGLQIFLMDDEQVLDSVFDEGLLPLEAPRDRTAPFTLQRDIVFDQAKLVHLFQTTQLGINLVLNTRQLAGDTLQLYPSDSISLQMGLRAKLNIPL